MTGPVAFWSWTLAPGTVSVIVFLAAVVVLAVGLLHAVADVDQDDVDPPMPCA